MRSAPVPNIPPIPGMCPSIAVMGGGGDGGGGSGNGPGDGSGNGPGSGGEGGDGTGGDGKGAGNCGPGAGGGCPNPAHGNGGQTHAGDPIDALTGRVFTLPATDLTLGGPLPLIIERVYSSSARKLDHGLGYGWNHSLGWRVVLNRQKVTLVRQDGTREAIDDLAAGESARTAAGVLRRTADGFTLLDGGRILRRFAQIAAASEEYLLVEISDPYGNRIALSYDARARLEMITDAVGRIIRVLRHGDGHIKAFEVKNASSQGQWVGFASYDYDAAGDLVTVTDARRIATHYQYASHRLTAETTGSGRTAHYVYDAGGRCVETWVDYPGQIDPSVDADAPALLADGVTRAKGVLHCLVTRTSDYVEVTNSREVKRYFRNELGTCDKAIVGGGVSTSAYDAWGELIQHTDPVGAVWQWDRDRLGRLLREIDPLGAVYQLRYDSRGFVGERVDPLGRILRYLRNHQGDVLSVHDDLGPLIERAYDDRGLNTRIVLPDGGVTRLSYDEQGNRVAVVEPNGGTRPIRYDFYGRVTGYTDEVGRVFGYQYDPVGNVVGFQRPDGTQTSFTYDRDNNLASVTVGTGHRYELAWSGYRVVHEVKRPDGTQVRFGYDRECDLVRVTNEAGEEHTIARDRMGRVLRECTFDGRAIGYRYDKVGHIVRIDQPDKHFVTMEWDLAGRMVKRTFDDDLSEEYEYDLLGRLLAASDGQTRSTFAYDFRGQMVAERQAFNGEEHLVESSFDAAGRRTQKRTDLGYAESRRFDAMGLPVELLVDGARAPLEFKWDLTGAELERRLPGGAALQNHFAISGLIDRRQLVNGQTRALRPGEPDWLGDDAGVLWSQSFTFDASGLVSAVAERGRGVTEFEFDAVGRLLKKLPDHARQELFTWDRAGNLFDGRPRSYDRGGKLTALSGVERIYDAAGRLSERKIREADGTLRAWKYDWDLRGQLREVRTPSGERISFTYDCFARRIEKRVERAGKNTVRTRMVWDHDDVVHEVRKRAAASGDPVVLEKTFAYMPGGIEPIAERHRAKDADETAGEWMFFVNDLALRPELLVDENGAIIERPATDAWGKTATNRTNIRFACHTEDEETGLFYNHFRYYDPDAGTYISPEPLGLFGGMRAFGYVDGDPIHRIDPDGQAGMRSRASDGSSTGRGRAAGRSGPGGAAVVDDLHPAVRGCLLNPDRSIEGAQNGMRHPASCAEPRAVSDYLRQRGVPDNASDAQVRAALTDMRIGANQNNSRPRAPCANCSQFLANLMARYGAPHPDNINTGFQSAQGNGDRTNFTPPPEGGRYRPSYEAARAAYHAPDRTRTGRAGPALGSAPQHGEQAIQSGAGRAPGEARARLRRGRDQL